MSNPEPQNCESDVLTASIPKEKVDWTSNSRPSGPLGGHAATCLLINMITKHNTLVRRKVNRISFEARDRWPTNDATGFLPPFLLFHTQSGPQRSPHESEYLYRTVQFLSFTAFSHSCLARQPPWRAATPDPSGVLVRPTPAGGFARPCWRTTTTNVAVAAWGRRIAGCG